MENHLVLESSCILELYGDFVGFLVAFFRRVKIRSLALAFLLRECDFIMCYDHIIAIYP